jgi:hypothetical protein
MTARERAWPARWVRAAIVVMPLGVGLPLLLLSQHYVAQLFGVFGCALAAYGLLSQVGQQLWFAAADLKRQSAWVRFGIRALPPLVLAALAVGLLWPCLLRRMPQSQDHPVHLTRAWHFVTRMLARGRLSGWSDLWFAGWPAGEDYPPGGDWWISSFYLGTFGLLGWEATYALAFVALLAAAAGAIYFFGRVHSGRIAGLLGGVFFLLDRGAYREGGWSYTVWWGVWPQVLSTAFTFAAFASLARTAQQGRARNIGLSALLVASALLTHPVATIYFAVGLPLYLLVRALVSEDKPGPPITRALAAFMLGGALAAFWVLPYASKGAWMAKYGELWKALPEMASGIWSGSLFQHVEPPLLWFGIAGGAVAAWRRNAGGVFLALFALTLLFAASSTAFQELDLLAVSPAFGQIQYQRLVIPVKISCFLLAGYALRELMRGRQERPSAFSGRRYALAALLIAAASPFLVPLGQRWGKVYGAELGRPKTEKQIRHWADYERFLSWSRRLRQRERGFYRIAYVRPYNDHFFAAAPVFNGTPAYKVGFTPCTTFVHKPDVASPELYRVLSVKYVVTLGQGAGPRTERVKRFGPISVYRFLDYSSQRYTLRGPGQVRVERFDPEGGQIQLVLSGTNESSRLILHQAPYPNWKASLDGRPLSLETAELARQRVFGAVAARDGLLTFRYGWTPIDVAATVLSWIAVVVLLLVFVERLRRPLWQRIGGRFAATWSWLERRGVWVGAAALLLGGGGVLLKLAASAPATAAEQQAVALIDRLDDARVALVRSGRSDSCRQTRAGRHQCSEQRWNYVGMSSERVGGQLRRCIWAHPVDEAELSITFPGVRLGKALFGHHGLTDHAARSAGGAPVKLEVRIDGVLRQSFTRTNRAGWADWRLDTSALAGNRAEVTFVVSTRRAGVRHYCFDALIER